MIQSGMILSLFYGAAVSLVTGCPNNGAPPTPQSSSHASGLDRLVFGFSGEDASGVVGAFRRKMSNKPTGREVDDPFTSTSCEALHLVSASAMAFKARQRG